MQAPSARDGEESSLSIQAQRSLGPAIGNEAVEASTSVGLHGNQGGDGNGGLVPVVVVELRHAKQVKDALKVRGWLSKTHKPGSMGMGSIAVPLLPTAEKEAQEAVAQGIHTDLQPVLRLERVSPEQLPANKSAPSQKGLPPPLNTQPSPRVHEGQQRELSHC